MLPEGYTKPSAKLEINVDVKYVGEDERPNDKRIKGGVGTVWGKWERGKDFGKPSIPLCAPNGFQI
jgi:hypothetical protein